MLAYVGVPKIWGRFVQLQVPHKFCCAPVPMLSEIWGSTCPLWRRRLWAEMTSDVCSRRTCSRCTEASSILEVLRDDRLYKSTSILTYLLTY